MIKLGNNKCRTCINGSKGLHPLTEMASEVRHSRKSYGQLLEEVTNTNIMDKGFNDMPQSICSCCIRKLKTTHAFVQQVQEVTDKLWSMLCNGNTDTQIDCLQEAQIDVQKCLEIKMENEEIEYKKEITKCEDKLKIEEPEENISPRNTNKEVILLKDSSDNNILNNIKNSDNEDNDDNIFDTNFSKSDTEMFDSDTSILSKNAEWQEKKEPAIGKKVKTKKLSKSKNVKSTNTDEDLPISCDQCNKVFPNSRLLHRHKKITHVPDELKVQCPYCPAKYNQLYNMYRHLRTQHKNEAIEEHIIMQRKCKKNPKKYACEQCTSSYTKKYTLLKHVKNRHGPESIPKEKLSKKRFLCTICGSKFDAQSHLDIHIRRHTGEKPYNCDLCDRTFYRLYDVQVHRRSHTGEKPYQCSLCEKAFDRSFRLQIHVRSHTNERPYKCTECEKAFKQSKHLNIHKRTHTGEKPFKCDVCDNAYTQRVSLRLHQTKHQHF